MIARHSGEMLAHRIPNDAIPPLLAAPDALLRLGVVIVGLVVASNSLPRLVLELFLLITEPGQDMRFSVTPHGLISPSESALRLGLALFLILRPSRVAKLIGGGQVLHAQDSEGKQAHALDAQNGTRK